MHVAVEDGLAGVCAGVDANIERGDRRIDLKNQSALLFHQHLHGIPLGLEQVEVVRDVALRDYQGVMFGNRKAIPEREGQLILCNDALWWQLTECATFVPASIGRAHSSEVRIVTVAFGGIARVTERLEVVLLVTPTEISRQDVIYFERLFIR